MSSGFSAIREAKKNFDQQQANWEGMRTRDMRLVQDGDSAVLWFVGAEPDEPRQAKVHTVSEGKKFSYELCAHGVAGHLGCVYDHVVRKGDKRVKKATSNFYFSVADSRFVHKSKNDEKSKSAGRDVFDWADCPRTDEDTDVPCKLCKRKVPRERGGLKKLRLGLTTAIVLDNLNNTLKKKCVNDGCGGKISTTGYRKGKKLIEDLEDIDADEQSEWKPEYECSKCDEPLPGSIYHFPIRMMRNGSGQTTTYSFSKEDYEDQPEWVQEIEPIDWDKVLTPRSADNMAQQLNVENPFDGSSPKEGKSKRKAGADPYDDDEDDDDDEEDDEPFDDDEEDEKPRKKKTKGED